jgi:hypothetical protein
MSPFRIAQQQPFRLQTAPSAAAPGLEKAPSSIATDRPVEATQPSRNRILRLELLVVLFIVCFGYFAWRTLKQEDTFREVGLSQSRSLLNLATSIADGNTKVDGLTKSVEGVTASLAQSTSKIGEFSDQLGQRQNEVQDLYARLRGVEIAVRKSQEVRPPLIDATAPAPSAMGHRPVASLGASPSNPHIHEFDLSIPMPGGTLAHLNFQRQVDYWMVPRMLPSGERFIKVEPYGTNSLGVKVHSIDDGMDYILTPKGGWMEGLGEQ